jgi:hypothetical protein
VWFGRSHNLNSRHRAGQRRTCEAYVDILEDRVGTDDAAKDDIAPGSWQPLSARRGGTPIDETWQEGIPAWIDHSVRQWLGLQLMEDETRDRLLARLHVTDASRVSTVTGRVERLTEVELLDWIDGVLSIEAKREDYLFRHSNEYNANKLETLLREGHSIWKVSDTCDSLERRQDETVTAAAHQAGQTAKSYGRAAAAERLRNAWSKAYGLHPDPSKAFGEAILAVEAVAVPAITPKEADAHLGHVYGQLRTQGHLYELAITDKSGVPGSVQPVTELVGLLWHGHTDRHEGNLPALPITQDAAEMAVHAASTLVQWFASGAIRRKPLKRRGH